MLSGILYRTFFCINLLLLMACFSSGTNAQQADLDLLRRINASESDFKNGLFTFTSNTTYLVNVAVPAAIGLKGILSHDKRLKQEALYMGGGLLLNTLLVQGMKRMIQRERPFVAYPDIVKRGEGGGYSMPSGHTASAFYTAASLSFWHPRWYVILPSFAWASLVGYGRIYQGVHYPSDVLVGALLGTGTAWLTYTRAKSGFNTAQKKKTVPKDSSRIQILKKSLKNIITVSAADRESENFFRN